MSLDSQPEIERRAAALLRRAGAIGRLPTPVDDIVAAAGLTEPTESILADDLFDSAPAYVQRAARKLRGRVVGLLDRRRREVHFDPSLTQDARRRFAKLHETGHGILPWQQALAYADDDLTLAAGTNELFELEASRAAAEMLFQGKQFADDTAESEIGFAAITEGCQAYGASLRAGLRRFVESHRASVVGAVLEPRPEQDEPLRFRRHEVVASPSYLARFGRPRWPLYLLEERFGFIPEACAAAASKLTVVPGDWTLRDMAGREQEMRLECFCTGYAVLILTWVPFSQVTRKRVRLIELPRTDLVLSQRRSGIR